LVKYESFVGRVVISVTRRVLSQFVGLRYSFK